eukprot:TRINITY_DN65289_c0_g1_i1.p1 TRINITY_DN65289_c0_g1~~TRINITY_DN65289_c0_g1_i1.p1  ORF type:complete len:421 (+),score=114.12 TRINITY_DN65289_c0_g1_i1:95-1264(+)
MRHPALGVLLLGGSAGSAEWTMPAAGPVDRTKLEPHRAQSGPPNFPAKEDWHCGPQWYPESWFKEHLREKRGIRYGEWEAFKPQVDALRELYQTSHGERWPSQFTLGWGDETKACHWDARRMTGPGGTSPFGWAGTVCVSNIFSRDPPEGCGGSIARISLVHGLVEGPLPKGLGSFFCNHEFVIKNNPKLNGPLFDTGLMITTLMFDLSFNALEGTIPDSFLPSPCVQVINLGNNRFTGPIPNAFKDRTALQALRLNNNQFVGTVPPFGNCPHLAEIDLSNNRISGTLPADLFAGLPKLRWLRLHQNALSGPVPPTVSQPQQFSVLSVADNPDMDPLLPDALGEVPLRVFNGTPGMRCSQPDLLAHVPESTACGGGAMGGSRATFLEPP